MSIEMAIKCLRNKVTCFLTEPRTVAIQACEDLLKFQAIGTIDEFLILHERSIPRLIECDKCGILKCPFCGTFITEKTNFCPHCGQAILHDKEKC